MTEAQNVIDDAMTMTTAQADRILGLGDTEAESLKQDGEDGDEEATELAEEWETARQLFVSAPALRDAGRGILAAFGGDVPDWLRPHADALAAALAAANGKG